MMGRRARRYREQSEIMPGWKEIRSIADVAQPRQPLYAVGRDKRLDGPCSILFRLARLALAHSPRAIRFPAAHRSDRLRSFAGQTDRNPGALCIHRHFRHRYTIAKGDSLASDRIRFVPTDRALDPS
jgi:hypothetical protein